MWRILAINKEAGVDKESESEVQRVVTLIRAGRDPDTGNLHITEVEAVAAITQLMNKRVLEAENRLLKKLLAVRPSRGDLKLYVRERLSNQLNKKEDSEDEPTDYDDRLWTKNYIKK